MKKLEYNYIKTEFNKNNYILLSKEYKNNKQLLDCMCPNGHKHFINYNNFKTGYKCSYCVNKAKPTIEFIKSEFKKESYILLSEKYINNKTDLDYICSAGHVGKIRWNNWRSGSRCLRCCKNQYTIENVRRAFELEGYTLLTNKYKTSRDKLDFICPKGHKHFITWSSWLWNNNRCFICKYIKQSGSGNPNWKGGISCEPYCFEWSSKEFKDFIKERDGNRCQNPDCRKNCNHLPLSIHHIDNNKKNCDPKNLITLCASCNSRANKDREWHKSWYQIILNKRYGYKYDKYNNSREKKGHS